MSNLGLHHAMRDAGIRLLTTPVGDRYVLEALREQDLSLGGEQSGHVVFADRATTGDGLLTALQLLGRVAGTGASLAELAAVVQRLPQVLINVPVADRARVATAPAVVAAVDAAVASSATTAGCCCAVRHRADRPGHGRGADPGRRRRDRPAVAAAVAAS